jgi:type VI secretion system protein ImpH
LPLVERDRTALGRANACLGAEVVLGERVWDRQHKFRIRIGPLSLAEYQDFLPASSSSDGASKLDQLVAWVRTYCCFEFDWDAQLVLRDDVAPAALGRGGRLGWTTWLGARRLSGDAAELCLNAEAFVKRAGVPVQ